jgi:hypothetical protein
VQLADLYGFILDDIPHLAGLVLQHLHLVVLRFLDHFKMHLVLYVLEHLLVTQTPVLIHLNVTDLCADQVQLLTQRLDLQLVVRLDLHHLGHLALELLFPQVNLVTFGDQLLRKSVQLGLQDTVLLDNFQHLAFQIATPTLKGFRHLRISALSCQLPLEFVTPLLIEIQFIS